MWQVFKRDTAKELWAKIDASVSAKLTDTWKSKSQIGHIIDDIGIWEWNSDA